MTTTIELAGEQSWEQGVHGVDRTEARLHRRLRAAGMAALLAAALGSVWSASSLAADPVGDQDCVMQVAYAVGFSDGCAEEASAGTDR